VKFRLDESAEYRIAGFLQDLGHDVLAIAHDYPESLADRTVLQIARTEERILITNDRDFGELIFRHNLPHSGVIYFRLRPESTADEKIAWLGRLFVTHADRLAQFIVVTPGRVRVRTSPR
jgi:predicted nuclease of predicted toxin-antitoxin system